MTFNVKIHRVLEQAKILRVFKLIGLLKNRPRSIESLALELETTTRTVYRYINLLEELGFLIDKDWNNMYFIHQSEEEEKSLYFTEDEAVLMKELIVSGLANHPLKESLQKKLFLNSELKEIPEQLLKARLGKLVEQLVEAINNKSQVVLLKYHSAHSGLIRDRLVEPYDFSANYETLIAFEPESKSNKHFKIERISEIKELAKEWEYEEDHKKPTSDIFGISGEDTVKVEFSMSLKAYLLLREEFPKSIPYLRKFDSENELYYFSGPVNGFKGIGRFVMGLLNEIEIIEPESFRLYIHDIIRNY